MRTMISTAGALLMAALAAQTAEAKPSATLNTR